MILETEDDLHWAFVSACYQRLRMFCIGLSWLPDTVNSRVRSIPALGFYLCMLQETEDVLHWAFMIA